jgi:hypothetical protein
VLEDLKKSFQSGRLETFIIAYNRSGTKLDAEKTKQLRENERKPTGARAKVSMSFKRVEQAEPTAGYFAVLRALAGCNPRADFQAIAD